MVIEELLRSIPYFISQYLLLDKAMMKFYATILNDAIYLHNNL